MGAGDLEAAPSQTSVGPLPQGSSQSLRQGGDADKLTPARHPADLKKYRRYEVVMTAYNVIGESPASAPVEVFVGEAGKPWCPHPTT